jgi:hypothetical protein
MDKYAPFGSQSGVPLPPERPDNEDDTDLQTDAETSPEDVQAAEPAKPLAEADDTDQSQRLDYLRNVKPLRQSSNSTWPRLVAGAIIVLVVIIGGWLVADHRSHKTTSKKTTTAQVAPSKVTSSAATANYVASGQDLNLSFDYPGSWSATPPSGSDTTDQAITVSSPLTTVTTATGSSVTGKVSLSIRPVSAQLTELAAGNATAAQASVQFAYSKPTANQFQYPFLTFIHVPANGVPTGAFQEVIVTGTTQFNAGDGLTADSFSVDPIISASFLDCLDAECSGSGAAPLNITNDIWQNTNLFRQTLTALESLQLN